MHARLLESQGAAPPIWKELPTALEKGEKKKKSR